MLSNICGHDYDEGDMMADMICCKDQWLFITLSCDDCGCRCEDDVLAKILMKVTADMICCMTSLGQ